MEMNLITDALRGNRTDRVPLWLMRQAGRYLPEYRELRAKAGGFLKMVYDPKLAAEITLQPLARFDLDAAILFSDILVVPHALGLDLQFMEGEGPKLDTVQNAADFAKLDEKGALARLAPIADTVANVKAALPQGRALLGFAGSPFTVASYMVHGQGGHDFGLIKNWIRHDPTGFQKLMDVLVRVSIDYLSMQVRAGAHAVQLFESWAGALSGDDYKAYVVAPNAAIVAGFKRLHPDVPVIGFPRTDVASDVQLFANNTGVNCVALSQGITPSWAAENLPANVCLQGNLAPETLLSGGDAMVREALVICEAFDARPFVFNLGHGVIKETDPANVGKLVDAVHGYKRKAIAA